MNQPYTDNIDANTCTGIRSIPVGQEYQYLSLVSPKSSHVQANSAPLTCIGSFVVLLACFALLSRRRLMQQTQLVSTSSVSFLK